jgi:hypothetical protein
MVTSNIDKGPIRPGRGSEISRRLPQRRQRIVGIDDSSMCGEGGKDGFFSVTGDEDIEAGKKVI